MQRSNDTESCWIIFFFTKNLSAISINKGTTTDGMHYLICPFSYDNFGIVIKCNIIFTFSRYNDQIKSDNYGSEYTFQWLLCNCVILENV